MEKKPAPACLVGGTAMQYWSSRRGPTLVLSFLQERPRIVRTLHPTMCSRCESRGGGTGINCSRVLEVWACQVAHMVVGSVGFVGSDGGWAPPVGGRESRTDDQHPPPCEVSRSPLSQRRTADRPARTGTPTLESDLLKETFSIERKRSKSGRFSLLPPPLVTRTRFSSVS